MKAIIPIAAILILSLALGCASRPPLATVPSVDLQRYLGTWYEIARYPNWFQRGCASDTTAEYILEPSGSILVRNSCRLKNGKSKTVEGRATVVPGSGNSKLKVGFGGPIRGDYWIIGLDEKNYSWALVGHPSRQFLWILARTPALSKEDLGRILSLAVQKGYDPSRIVMTPHTR